MLGHSAGRSLGNPTTGVHRTPQMARRYAVPSVADQHVAINIKPARRGFWPALMIVTVLLALLISLFF